MTTEQLTAEQAQHLSLQRFAADVRDYAWTGTELKEMALLALEGKYKSVRPEDAYEPPGYWMT